MTQAITGPMASSRSWRQGADTQMLNSTHAAVSEKASKKCTVGRSPNSGRGRAANHPPTRGGAAVTTP